MDGPPRSLFNDIAVDWEGFVRSSGVWACLARWSTDEPELASFERVEGLLSGLRARQNYDQRDAAWFAVLRLARRDPLCRGSRLYACCGQD